jgi:hypothetical protein
MGAPSVPTQTDMAKERTGETVTVEDTQKQMEHIAEREEDRRDMLHDIQGIEQDESEILFQDTSPRRPMAILYATLDGEPLIVTKKRARVLFQRRLPDGRPMFASDIKKAPPYQKGAVKCFLHKDSPDRELMDSLGLQGKICPAGQLANAYAKYIHESGKHVKTWDIWQKHVSDKKETEAIERQDRQFEATMQQNAAILELARSNQTAPPAGVHVEVEDSEMPPGPLTMCDVEGCDYTGTVPQVRGHKLGAHK